MAAPPPAVVAFNQEQARRTRDDWGNLCRYRDDNAARVAANAPAPTAVFMGDSITEGWARTGADFFAANGYVGRVVQGKGHGPKPVAIPTGCRRPSPEGRAHHDRHQRRRR
jgi:hypothetical protein